MATVTVPQFNVIPKSTLNASSIAFSTRSHGEAQLPPMKTASHYQPITEKDLDIEFLSVIPRQRFKNTLKHSPYLIAPLMVLLPLLYLSFIVSATAALFWHARMNISLFYEPASFINATIYLAPIISGFFILSFLTKPLIAKPTIKSGSTTLNSEENALLRSYVNKIADKVGIPHPTQIQITLEPKVELSVMGGFTILQPYHLNLTVGLPLFEELNSQELASLITREFVIHREHTNKKAVWLISQINQWFYRVSKQPDSWDVILENTKETRQTKLPEFLVVEVQSIIKLTRKILSLFYYVSEVISRHVVQDLYFRADDINCDFCGFDAIKSGETHLYCLSYGLDRCRDIITNTGIILDKNLAKTISDNAKTIAKVLNQRNNENELLLTTIGAPPWKVRLKRIKQKGSTVLYEQKYPAKCLLPKYDVLGEMITTNYYKNYHDIDNSSCALINELRDYNVEKNLVGEYFNHLFRFDHVLTPNWLHEEYGSTIVLKRDLQNAINKLRQLIPDWKNTIEELDDITLRIQQAQLNEKKLSPKSTEKQQLILKIEKLKHIQNGLLAERSTVDDLLNQRLSLGLSYYATLIGDQEKDRLTQSINTLNVLKNLQPYLQSLSDHGQLLEQQLCTPVEKRGLFFDAQLKKSSINCGKSIARIRLALEKNTQNPSLVSLANSIRNLKNGVNKKNPAILLNTSRQILELLRSSYANIMTQTVCICTASEHKLAINPLTVSLGEPLS